MSSKRTSSTGWPAFWGFTMSLLMVASTQAQEPAGQQYNVQAGGSLAGREVPVRMSIDNPLVKRQQAIRPAPPSQPISRPQQAASSDVVRIDVPPGSHEKENDSPFFQFRQLPSSDLAPSDGEYLSREARENQVEQYRRSLLSNKD